MEKRLKDYKGFIIWKIVDDEGIFYEATDQDYNLFNACKTLDELKKSIDNYVK